MTNSNEPNQVSGAQGVALKLVHAAWYVDQAEGWLQVPGQAVEMLGIAGELSTDSRIDGKDVYLHEDLDEPLFMKAAEAAGLRVVVSEKINSAAVSPVRSMARFDVYWLNPANPQPGDQLQLEGGRTGQILFESQTREKGKVLVFSPDDDPWDMMTVPKDKASQYLLPLHPEPDPRPSM
jgi:hypothetical protein